MYPPVTAGTKNFSSPIFSKRLLGGSTASSEKQGVIFQNFPGNKNFILLILDFLVLPTVLHTYDVQQVLNTYDGQG